MVQKSEFEEKLDDAYRKSKIRPFLWSISFSDFIQYQKSIKDLLGDDGFIMFTEKRAVVCLKKAPDLRIYLKCEKYFGKKDFNNLCFGNLEILGAGKMEFPSPTKQYIIDVRDNLVKIIIITIVFLSIYNLEKANIEGLISLCDNLINAISIFVGMVFVFIGFIYSEREKALDIYLKGCGDKYFRIDKYIMNLSILSLFVLILVSSIGGLTFEDIPQFLISLQKKNVLLERLISYKFQYYICLFMTWFSICSMVICFDALINYYLNDLRNGFFIDAVNKKAEDFRGKDKPM